MVSINFGAFAWKKNPTMAKKLFFMKNKEKNGENCVFFPFFGNSNPKTGRIHCIQ